MSNIGDLFRQQSEPPVLAEPDADEAGDEIVFVRGGFVRITIAGVMYKLRRPFLGELRELEATMDHAAEELKRLAAEFKDAEQADQAEADRITATAAAADDSDLDVRKELGVATSELAARLNERLTRVQRLGESFREDWWRQAFEMLTPAGGTAPDSLPAWVTDGLLQRQVIEHWQSSPLAPGR